MYDEEEGNIEVPELSKFDETEDLTPFTEFQMRPHINQRFRSKFVKGVIYSVLHEELDGKVYGEEDVEGLIKSIANMIRKKLEGGLYHRYKLIVHVNLGEQRGAGVKCAARCLWDPECDSYACGTFINDTMFCVATVFGIYFY